MVRDIWLEKIFSGTKWLEIRPHSVKQGRIYLCQSKTSTVFGHARVEEVLGPLRADEWETLRERGIVSLEGACTSTLTHGCCAMCCAWSPLCALGASLGRLVCNMGQGFERGSIGTWG